MTRVLRRNKAYLLLSTVGSYKEAKKIAHALVRNRLAACVNIIPEVNSVFRWQGTVDQARESLLVIKTELRSLKQVERAIREHHSYEVPEMVAWPIKWGHQPYLKWLFDSVD